MKYQLIVLPNQPILISDEEVKNGDSVLFNMSSTVVHKNIKVDNTSVYDEKGKLLFDKKGTIKVVAGIPELPSVDFSDLSKDDCKKIGWIDVEKIAMDKLKNKWSHLYSFGYPKRPFPTNYENDLNNIKVGIYESQSLNEKKFSEAEMRLCYMAGWNRGKENKSTEMNNYIQFVSQPKIFDVEVKMEEVVNMNYKPSFGNGDDSHYNPTYIKQPEITDNSIKITKIL